MRRLAWRIHRTCTPSRCAAPRPYTIVALVAAVLFATALDAVAQSATPQTATEIVDFLMLNQAVPTADFERDRAAAEAARQTIVNALLVNLVAVPLSTSSSGFIYRFNEQLGTVERATDTFGPFFVERALTPARGRASVGVSASTSRFDELDGRKLRDGTLVTIANRFRDEPAPFDTESLTLRIRSSTMTIFGSVPVTDNLEIGGALPLVRMSLDGERINVYRGSIFSQAAASADASGIGDIALRAKYLLFSEHSVGVAAAGELRLPTGDSDNLLGAGSTGWRFTGIASYEPPRFALHVNAGMAGGGVSNERTAGAAALAAVSPRLTLSGELLIRRVSELRHVGLSSAPHPTIIGVDTLRLTAVGDGTTTTQIVAGAKWNVAQTVVVGAHVRWSATSTGLTAPFTPTIALEYAF
jgi:hypothetical protein